MSTSPANTAKIECPTCLFEPAINPVQLIHNPTNDKCKSTFCKFCQDDWERTCHANTKNPEPRCYLCQGSISGYVKLYEGEDQPDDRYSKFKPKPLEQETNDTSLSPTRAKWVKALKITAAIALPILFIIGSILLAVMLAF